MDKEGFIMKIKHKIIFMFTLAIIGITLIIIYSHWLVAVGVFLFVWANGLDKRIAEEIQEKKKRKAKLL